MAMTEVMTFKFIENAQKRWLRLYNPHYVADIIRGVPFANGMAVKTDQNTVLEEQIGAA